ncbi:hypothetical protein OG211_24290 [Streptomyces niveus]|uniref:hypothetical protein n=1 Tax=Streptomyces niveus TaxID=193462 RepID=UPI00386753D8|nr:hypothetical protein OG211_24290 [Streptomyces niveus]
MTTRRRTYGRFCAILASSLALVVGGCSGDDDGGGKAPDVSMAPDKLCGGGAVTKGGAEALEVITGATRFEDSGKDLTIAAAAKELTRTAVSTTQGNGDICRIYPDTGDYNDGLEVTWRISGSAGVGPDIEKFTPLPMGERTAAAHDTAYVTFACGHKDRPDSSPDHVTARVGDTKATVPDGDERALKNAYATLAHSFALALAKELGCEDNGGLKPEPSLIPAT